jgi:hypothetical protein
MLQQLRELRNRVTYEPGVSLSVEKAIGYPRQALSSTWALAVRHPLGSEYQSRTVKFYLDLFEQYDWDT